MKGSNVTIYFEAGKPGDLTPAQQQQYLNGAQYWTRPGTNYGGLTFTNSGNSTNPNGATNTIYVQMSSNMLDNNAEDTSPSYDQNGTVLSEVVTLNINYFNGTILSNATPAFQSQPSSAKPIY